MQILVAEQLIKQTKNKRMQTNVVAQIYSEIDTLTKLSNNGYNTLKKYLENQNGKELKGSENVYKYRLRSGDRIFYTWASKLSYLKNTVEDTLVVFEYSKHDQQGRVKLPPRQDMMLGKDIVNVFSDFEITAEDLADMSIEDISAIVDIFNDNYHNSHAFYVINPKDFQDRDPDVIDVHLSEEQNQYIDEYFAKRSPLLILGGAGTGKTIMATHILNDYVKTSATVSGVYLTQSRELLSKVKEKFEYISKMESDRNNIDQYSNRVEFRNLNDFCRNALNLSESNLVRADEFFCFLDANPDILIVMKRKNIYPMDLWTEIRGTIKGGLDESGKRFVAKDRQQYSGPVISVLDKIKVLEWQDGRHIIGIKKMNETELTVALKNIYIDSEEIFSDAKALYHELSEYFGGIDYSLSLMPKVNYLSLKEELTTLAAEHREFAYEVTEKYQQWLGQERFDENDLVCKYMLLVGNDVAKVDMVVVDEIQDYSELQISLMKKMVHNEAEFVMAGDTHQIINPTSFSERRMQIFFQEQMREVQLKKNFRCQREIVNMANGLSRMRSTMIAKDKRANIVEEATASGEIPRMLKYSEDNIKSLLTTVMNYPGVAILVPNKEVKKTLIEMVGTTAYSKCPDFIWTVADIKGMEYPYVICYNMISSFQSIWSIISESKARKQSRYRYYFNLFYVAITRAQKYLCFVEQKKDLHFYKNLQQEINVKLPEIRRFSETDLWIDQLENNEEAWIRQAKRYESSGNYEQAIENYSKAGIVGRDISRCQMKLLFEKYQYEEALKIALVLEDEDMADCILMELDTESYVGMIANIWRNPLLLSRKNGYQKGTLVQLVNYIYEDEADKELIISNIIKSIDDSMLDRMNNLYSIYEV